MRLLGISGSLGQGSRTSLVIRCLLDAAAQDHGIETEPLEVSRPGLAFCDGRPLDASYDFGALHAADVGPDGVECLEAHLPAGSLGAS